MTDKQLAKLERELAELDALLGEFDNTAEKDRAVPVKEGIDLLKVLDAELRPFIIRYTALLNRSKQYIPIESSKLERFMPLAEKLSDCEELTFASYGTSYVFAIDMILNGVNCRNSYVTDIDELIQFLFYEIQLTDDAKGTISLFTFTEGSGLGGIKVVKDEDAV